jgi:hypothetical protein
VSRPASQRPTYFRRAVHSGERIAELYASGLSMSEVAYRVGCSPSLVGHKLALMGIKMRSRGEGRSLAHKRGRRLSAIAEAAQRQFGHLYAPPKAPKASEPMPVNTWFDDDDSLPDFDTLEALS